MTTTTPELLREQVAIMLAATKHHATRQIPKVGDEDHPTPWDLDHRRINELLTEWQNATT